MTEGGPRRRAWLRWLPLAVLLGLSLGIAAAGGAHLLDLDRIAEARAALQAAVAEDRARAIGLMALVFVGGVVVSIPAVTVALTALSGLLFGTLTGALISVGSATTGAMIVFSIGRLAAGDLIRRRAGPRLGRFAEGFRRDGFGYVLTLRLLPIFPFWMTNLTPAAFGVSFRSFFLATLLGLMPGAFVFSGLGAGLDELLAAREATRAACLDAGGSAKGSDCAVGLDLRSLVSPTLIAALAGLAAFALLSVYLRRRLERRTLRA